MSFLASPYASAIAIALFGVVLVGIAWLGNRSDRTDTLTDQNSK